MKKGSKPDEPAKPRGRKPSEPLEIRLSLSYRFGDEPDDTVNMMNGVPVPMVDSVFKNRDRILRAFAMTLLRAGITKPKVLREIVPGLDLLRVGRSRSKRS